MFEKQEIKTFCADITDYNQLSDVLSQVSFHFLKELPLSKKTKSCVMIATILWDKQLELTLL